MHGGGWHSYVRSGDEKPQKVTKELLLRVLTYARPYWNHIGGMLVTILFGTGLSLVSPLIFRQMIDKVIAEAREFAFRSVCVNPCWVPFTAPLS